ncbi:MAG: two-component sensor histidine kinase [Clostridia bacterium]|nr:two-component sensor histidine kinase [Clostridia bacterium]
MVIISVMMLIAFTSIYLITYNNVHSGIAMELGKISEPNRKGSDNSIKPQPDFDKPAPPHRSVWFALITDKQWNTVAVSSIFDMEAEFYVAAKDLAISEGSLTGEFKLEGNYWAYRITPYVDGYRIVFLDISSQQGILNNLVYTFLIVASVMLIFIFIISRFFANKAIQPVQEAFEKQKQFIADASHELKTPLTVINTNVDVLLSNDEINVSEHAKWLYYIKSEVERMTKLTNDLLYLTQLDYSDMKIIYTNFDLSKAVESVVLTMEAVIFENQITFKDDIEPNLKINGNSEQIKQVVMILLDNAIKYTNKNGTVSIELKKSYNNLIMSVINTGEGIPTEHLDKIFDRFYRIDKSRVRNNGGYGLGLSIAKTIIAQHRGKISVRSVANEYTKFSIEMPLIN